MTNWLRRTLYVAAASTAFATLAAGAFLTLDRAFPPPLPEKIAVSAEVLDRDGALLRAYATTDGRWRLRPASIRSIRNSSTC